jgi:hypothetical protein
LQHQQTRFLQPNERPNYTNLEKKQWCFTIIEVMIDPTKLSMVFFMYFVMTIEADYLFKNLKKP